ncbi:MAG: V-type ATP synthase subunit K [Desulfurococcales archaeon]|nr:V-type ATP synthase subunit K [Desulfurococcales archaeon]
MSVVVKALKVLMADKRFKVLTLLAAVIAVFAAFATISLVTAAQEAGQQTASVTASSAFAKGLSAALAVGLAGIGGGYAVGVAGAAAISAIAENREISGTALLYVALGEGIAIYGLLVALLVLFVI